MGYLQEIAELREELRRHSIAYYDKDAPTISDFEYDAMMRRLENLEAEHPETVTPDSPTQHVGGHRSEKFSPVHHAVPLESLSDVFSYEELTDFIRKTNETLGGDRSIRSSRKSTVFLWRWNTGTASSIRAQRAATALRART